MYPGSEHGHGLLKKLTSSAGQTGFIKTKSCDSFGHRTHSFASVNLPNLILCKVYCQLEDCTKRVRQGGDKGQRLCLHVQQYSFNINYRGCLFMCWSKSMSNHCSQWPGKTHSSWWAIWMWLLEHADIVLMADHCSPDTRLSHVIWTWVKILRNSSWTRL